MMRYIDTQTWPRRAHFELFGSFDHPHFDMCANVDVTSFYPIVKARGCSVTVSIAYVLSRAANSIPEFRYRLRGADVVEHEIVHPAITLLTGEDLFSFCFFEYVDDFSEFAARAAGRIADARANPTLSDEPGDEWLYMTAIPWVSFTSFRHPVHLAAPDSVPRFAWGKFFDDGQLLKMPLEVQVHHGMMDGIHVGKFYTAVQDTLNRSKVILGGA